MAKTKPGQCPVIKRLPCPLILKPDECTTDWDCAGDLKCCSDGCTKECSSGFLSEKRGGLVCVDLISNSRLFLLYILLNKK